MFIGQSDNEYLSNFGSLTEMLYLSPALISGEALFEFQHDIGLMPTNLTRIVVISFYVIIYWLVVMFIRVKKSHEM